MKSRSALSSLVIFSICILVASTIYLKEPALSKTKPLKQSVCTNIIANDLYFIGVNTAPKFYERVSSILMTWGQEANVKFFSCVENGRVHPRVTQDKRIPCDDYPPVKTWMYVLLNMAQTRAHWYLKCDDDSYVNMGQFVRFLLELDQMGVRHTGSYYAGSVGFGREKERHLIGLNGTGFVLGGPCVLMSYGAMQRLVDILQSCMEDPVERMHSDTQLGRCFRKLNISAGLPSYSNNQLRDMFRQFYSASTHIDGAQMAAFADSSVPDVLLPNKTYLTMHSIKTRSLMLRVHAQLVHGARPIRPENKSQSWGCYHNPQMLQAVTTCNGLGFSPYWTESTNTTLRVSPPNDKCSLAAPECLPLNVAHFAPAVHSRITVKWIDSAYIITLVPSSGRVRRLASRLQALGFTVQVSEAVNGAAKNLSSRFLTPGELGVIHSHRKIFVDALNKRYRTVAVFEDDALLHKNIELHLSNVFSCSRCSCYLHSSTGCTPGILLLGSTIHNNRSHQAIDAEMRQHNYSTCANYIPYVYGAFAVIYNVDLFPSMLHWMDGQRRFPYDWLFSYAAQEGYIVRLAIPRLAIADLDQESTVKKRLNEGNRTATLARYAMHRWHREDYE